MSEAKQSTVLAYLRRLVGAAATDSSDAELLERFAEQRDEAAFEALLRRHGPLVWNVCRLYRTGANEPGTGAPVTLHELMDIAKRSLKAKLELSNNKVERSYQSAAPARGVFAGVADWWFEEASWPAKTCLCCYNLESMRQA